MKILKIIYSWFKRLKFIAKIFLILILLLLTFLFFVNTIAKYYINNNGEDITGRVLHVDELHINYLTFAVSIEDFVMYEVNKKDTFVYLGYGYVNMQPWSIAKGEFSFSEVTIDRIEIELIQYQEVFNFSDLISDEPADTTSAPTKYILKNLNITNSQFTYVDGVNNTKYPLKDLEISLPELAWNSNKTDVDLEFNFGKKGSVDIDFLLDNVRKKYDVDFKSRFIDIQYGEAYLVDLLNVNSVTGFLHTDLKIKGDLINALDIQVEGTTSITKLDIIDAKGRSFSSIDSLGVVIDSMNIRQNHFSFSKAYVQHPIGYVEVDRNTTNIDYVLAPVLGGSVDTSNVVSDSTKQDSTPFFFEIKEVEMKSGLVNYVDKTLDRPFKYSIRNLNLTAKNISPSSSNLSSIFSFNMEGESKVVGDMTMDLVNTNNIHFKSVIKGLNLTSFSPYSEYYIASPITQGIFNYDVSLEMNETSLMNNNSIDIREMEFGKKIKSDSSYKVPIKLALTLLKDKNDNIQFDVPVTGNPSDPDFRIFPLVWKTLGQFMVKVAASPLKAVSSMAGKNAEDLEYLPFEYGQTVLNENQIKILDKIIEFHIDKPQLTFTFNQMTNSEEEKEVIALQEAKKMFKPESWFDVSDNNADFISFLQLKTASPEEKSATKMALKYISSSVLKSRLAEIIKARNIALENHFSTVKNSTNYFIVQTADLINLPEEMKKPQFKIEVGVE